jgi:hypothetical protein
LLYAIDGTQVHDLDGTQADPKLGFGCRQARSLLDGTQVFGFRQALALGRPGLCSTAPRSLLYAMLYEAYLVGHFFHASRKVPFSKAIA